MNPTLNQFLKSKIIWVQLLAIAATVLAQYGQLNLMNPALAMFFSFAITVILQKFASDQPIITTGISGGKSMFWVNLVGAVLMIGDYFMDNKLFEVIGGDASKIGMAVLVLNLVLRTWFLNQPNDTTSTP